MAVLVNPLPVAVRRLPVLAVVAVLRLYQRAISPIATALAGPGCGCRFTPTCSHYAADAVLAHGVLKGGRLAACRLAKCHPFHPGGSDLVPPIFAGAKRHSEECRGVAPSSGFAALSRDKGAKTG
jgi:putative membrane protein insertion efficiency factor